MRKIVHILHCVDAEGPFVESLEATFERLYDIFDIRLEATEENLTKIQNQKIDFGEKTEIISKVFNAHNLKYHGSWDEIDAMLLQMMHKDFRNTVLDSFGRGWIYNWHCVDHIGYTYNPRKRVLGFHKVFDHYKKMIEQTNSYQDGHHFHFHPMTHYLDAHRHAKSYMNSPHLYEILCRRIIERRWFPVAFRPGFHIERPDSNWFLEQWIPFDISNWSHHRKNDGGNYQEDVEDGRFQDWRLAPNDWSIYHPSHDYYQLPGHCRRWICRVLSITVRGAGITQDEVDKAFERAAQGKPTIMAVTNHDFRDMVSEVDLVRGMIVDASKKFPDVQFKFCEAVEAFRGALYDNEKNIEPVQLHVTLEKKKKTLILNVDQISGKVFGPQPFLAI